MSTDPPLRLIHLSKEIHVPEKPDPSDPSNSAVKPGYTTSEFYLSAAAMLVGIVLASGLLSPDNPTHAQVLQVLGVVSALLASMGYTVVRGSSKRTAIEGAAALAIAKVRPQEPSEPK